MRGASHLGLRGRVALLIGLAIAPAICILLYTGLQERRLAGSEALAEAQRIAHLTASSQEGLLVSAPRILGVLAHVPQVRDGNRETCTKFLAAVRSEYPIFLNIGRVELNGDVNSSALPTRGVVHLGDRSWFRRAIQTGRPSVGEFQIGRITGKPSINFGYPVLDARRRTKWVLFAALDLAGIERVAAKTELPEGATVTVTDRKGTILVQYPHEERWVGLPTPELQAAKSRSGHAAEGTFRAKGPDGVPRLYAYATVGGPTSGAQLTVGIPEDTAFAQVDRLLVRNLTLLSVMGLLAISLAFFGVDLLILRSLRLLIAATQRLTTGDLSVRTGLTGAQWELGQLAYAFDQMAEALQRRAQEHEASGKRDALLLELYEKASHLADQELYIYALDQAVALTDSTVGFFHQVSEDQQRIILTTWNLEALKTCTASPTAHYPVESAGNWADCVRLRAPVVYNDYPNSPNRKGLPPGHSPVKRFMSIPVMDDDKVRYIFGVGNKVAEYDDNDVVQLQLVANELHKIIEQRQAAEALRESETKFRFLFDTMAQGVLLEDTESRVIEANQAACVILGRPMDQLLGTVIADPEWELTHEDGSPLGVDEMPSRIALRTGLPVSGVTIGIRLPETKAHRWLLASTVPRFKTGDDKPYVTMTTFTDITERKRTEEELSRLSTLLDQTQSLAGVGGWEIDVQHNTLYWTSETYRTHDLTPSEYTPTVESALAFYAPESRPVITAAVREAVEHGTDFDLELNLITAKGRPITSHLISKAIIENGKTVRIVGAGVDITERKQAEQALRDSEERFRTVFETANDAILLMDGETIIDCNGRAVEMFGLNEKAEVIGHTPADFSPASQPDGQDSQAMVRAYHDAARSGTPQRIYWRLERRDGTPIDVEVSLSSLDLKKKTFVQAIVRDITEHKQAEQALRDSEERFRTVFESAYDAILLMDGDTFIDCNAQAVEMYGCTDKNDLIAHTPLDFSPASQPDGQESRPAAMEHINTALGGTPQRFYWKHLREDGTPFDAEVSLNALALKGKTYIQAIVRDVTKRKQAEEALQESEERFRSIVESSPTGMHFYTLRPDGDLVLIGSNPAADRALRIAHSPLLGQTIEQAFPNIVGTAVPDLYRKVAAGETGPQAFEMPYGDARFSGYYHVTVFSIGPSTIAADFIDITKRRQAEEALRRAHDELELRVQQRTAELSRSNAELEQFAYVASHDLQEPLRKIMAFGDRLDINAGPSLDERNRDYLRRMLNAADRMSGLINALLAYSRVTTKAQPFSPVNLSDVVREVLSDLEVAIEEAGAAVEVGELPTIDADASQMRQLLQNLIGNALKFRREGVPPRVRIEAETIPAPTAEGAPAVSNVMRLRVIDNGIGFDERFADRIFEVFERLHGRDQYAGSGMGLAICRKIAERHRGTITASSRPGEGSVFTVTLPVEQQQEGTTT
ncbi:MAG: PAS domain S-box protein [Armatimonadia bacterium]